MSDPGPLLEGAREWLAAAGAEGRAGRLRVAFEAARHAAELAAKGLLSQAAGEYPKSHLVAGPLAQRGLVPPGVDPKALHRLLSDFTLGTYGFTRDLDAKVVEDATHMASLLVRALEEALGLI